ncbi:hypothetical protein EJB05_17605 [Eragrostis curvula]|uniref:BZIP domain-containing protein n=1 Tax=Eragrostis curvula TaxID=38414 RepID=A0A5J9VJS8_9POAL|nr:hypothetical protein EJB05_17605 [Eragrostis curvula]
MGHDEAVVTQISGKPPSPAKDQPAPFPFLDWSAIQNLPTAAFGKPYPAIYPHAGGFLPFMPLMVNPLNAEPAKSVNSKDNSLNKKLKETDGTAVSTGSGVETCGASVPNARTKETGKLATLANVRIPDAAIKPCVSTGSDFRVSSTPSTEWPAKDDKESKRERRKQSNRESARRSRLRKQAETEELARKVELLTAENASLRTRLISKTHFTSQEKLTESAPEEAQEEVPADNQTVAAPPPARVVKNFLSIMDGAGAPRSSRHMDHGAPRLRQLLGSGPLAADAVAAS